MYFLVNTHTEQVISRPKLGSVAKQYLYMHGEQSEGLYDPVRAMFDHPDYGKEWLAMSLSDAVKHVEEQQSKDFTRNLQEAINEHYNHQKNRR